MTEMKDRQTLFEKLIPDIYNSKPSKILKNLVRHKFGVFLTHTFVIDAKQIIFAP